MQSSLTCFNMWKVYLNRMIHTVIQCKMQIHFQASRTAWEILCAINADLEETEEIQRVVSSVYLAVFWHLLCHEYHVQTSRQRKPLQVIRQILRLILHPSAAGLPLQLLNNSHFMTSVLASPELNWPEHINCIYYYLYYFTFIYTWAA